MKEEIMCCFIGLDKKRCKKEAEFRIIYGNAPNDITESCASHVGELVDDSIGRFEVIRLESNQEECSICHGKGYTIHHHDPCTECDGTGRIG